MSNLRTLLGYIAPLLTLLILPIVVLANNITLNNPIAANNLLELGLLLANALRWVAFIIAPLMIIVAGFYFVTAGANPSQINTARQILIFTLVGFAIVLSAIGIIFVVAEVLGVPTPPPPNNTVNIADTIGNITDWVMGFFIVVAFTFFIVSAYYWVMSGGDPSKIATAKAYLIYGIIGVLVAFSAFGLLDFIENDIIAP